jgi:hypothetical protein
MGEIDLTAIGSLPSELDQIVRSELTVNSALVKSIGLKLD